MKKTGKLLGVFTALSLTLTAVFPVSAFADLTEEQSGQISTAIILAENDMQANEAAIRILLEQCLQAVDENDPMAATIRSVILLLDTGTADAGSVAVLLQSLLDSMEFGETDDAQDAQTPTESDQPAETPDTQAQPQTEEPEETVPPQTQDTSVQETAQTEQADVTQQQPQTEPETMSPEKQAALENDPTKDVRNNMAGLPVYEVSSYIRTILQDPVTLEVPEDWGNNASGRALTSYSPVNDSGAISPAAGTLTVSYFPMETSDERTALDMYEKNIADMSVVTSFASEYVSAAQLSGRYLYFTMTVGANRFTCETFCFAYEGSIYAIELMQGQQTSFDYFPMYAEVVDSTQAGNMQVINGSEVIDDGTGSQIIDEQIVDDGTGQIIDEQIVDDGTGDQSIDEQIVDDGTGQIIDEQIVDDGTGDQIIDEQIVDDGTGQGQGTVPVNDPLISEDPSITNVDEDSALADISVTGDMSVFQYEVNGHVYQFPTAVRDIQRADIPIDPDQPLPYNLNSDADMQGEVWHELVNAEFYNFDSPPYKEIVGVTNLAGYQINVIDGVLTALIDTQGTFINVTLPGGIKVGSYETDLLKGFPRFANTTMDGLARFAGNELLYARNVRDDGCNGYVLVRNDPPYYSAVSIICDQGIIKEISFECLGPVRAEGVFLP